VTRLLAVLALTIGLAGCVVAPYGYAPAYGYYPAPAYYAPSVNVGVGWHGR
jgi:hypothetical protein